MACRLLAPSHYLNQCWRVVNLTPRNIFRRKLNQNSNIFIQENASESDVCQKSVILSRPQSIKPALGLWHGLHRSNYIHVKQWVMITHPCPIFEGKLLKLGHGWLITSLIKPWASCQIRNIAGAHAPGMPGTFSPSPQVSDPDMHHGTLNC